MADCTIRNRDESWVEVVLSTPTYAGELGKAHNVMLGQLGLDGAVTNDDVYEVVVGDDEVILRARRPKNMHRVTWAESAVEDALRCLVAYRDGKTQLLIPSSQTVAIAIDALRSLGADDA